MDREMLGSLLQEAEYTESELVDFLNQMDDVDEDTADSDEGAPEEDDL